MLPSTFPRRPRVRPFFHVVPLSGGRVQLRSAYRALVISGAGAPNLMQMIFPLLDGTRTAADIVAACSGHAPDAVRHALAVLEEKSVLEDAAEIDDAAPSPADRVAFADQVRLFSASVGNPWRCQADLQRKRVALVGLSPLGLAVGRQLAHCGVGSLLLVPAGPRDAEAGAALAADTNRNGAHCRVSLAPPVGEAAEESLAAACADAHLVIAPNDDPSPGLNRTINQACLSIKVPWLPVMLFGHDVGIGPLVVPGQTACFTCYELRMKGNLMFADEYVAFEQHLLAGNGSRVAQGGLNVYPGIAAGLAAVEAVKFLTRFEYPLSVGRLIRFNLANFQQMVHTVLRLPRCPRCGPIQPVVREWEL